MSFTSVHKIRFDDVDGAGIVYYPQYFHLCHAAFEDFFDTAAPITYPEMIRDQRLGFPTVAIGSEFKAPLSYGDVAVIDLSVKRIGTSSVVFHYELRRRRDGELCFSADVTTVLIDLNTERPVPLPEAYLEMFGRFLGSPGDAGQG